MDEFNRIQRSILSVVATQLQHLQRGLSLKLPSLQFDGSQIPLDPKLFIAVTSNPGYGKKLSRTSNSLSRFLTLL